MRTIVVITLLISLVASKQLQKIEAAGTKDFVTGFFLAMRAGEFLPSAFDCATNAGSVLAAAKDVQAQIHNKAGAVAVIKGIENLVKSFTKAFPGCKSLTTEGKAYVKEIKEIVTAQTFLVTAAVHLYRNRQTAMGDIKDFKQAKADGDNLLAGLKIGEFGRIIVWGTPAE